MGGTALRVLLASSLFAGCGKVSTNPADGIDADLGGDATVVTEAALFGGTVGAKVGDIDIVSNLPNNAVLATAKTDASGSATIRVYPGGSVTAVYKHTVDMGADLITWVGVKPGDTLTFGSRLFSTAGQQNTNLGAQTYSWPALVNATSYQVFTSCSSNSAAAPALSLSITEFSLCHREPMDVLFRALNGSTLIGFNFRSNAAFASGGNVSIASWITTVPMASINVTGLPPEITSVSGNFSTVLDANRQISFSNYSGTPTGGAFSSAFGWHATGDRTVGTLFLGRPGFSGMQLLDSFSASTLSQTVAAPALPPWGQGVVNASSALRSASWFLVPDASSVYDGQLLHLNWNHKIGDTFHPFQWDIILPPEQTSIEFPALPPPLSDSEPFPEDNLFASTRVFEIPAIADYDMIRAQPSANIMCLDCAVLAGDLQRVVLTQLFNPLFF